VPDLLV